MYLLAVSGGPDSMYLLNEYKNKAIIVAHVNYAKREDSHVDQETVEEFCKRFEIPYFVYNAKKDKITSNFQDEARKIRYKFFKEVYTKNKCDKLVIGHHKDDWLETAIMQEESGRQPLYYGIRVRNRVDGMNVYRPYINLYWKSDIEKKCQTKKIPYATDSTNKKPIFERNRVRERLSKMTKSEKKELHKEFVIKNRKLQKKLKYVIGFYSDWKKDGFSAAELRNVPEEYQNLMIYELIYDHFSHAKVSSGKLDSLKDFIFGKDGGKTFKIDKTRSISKLKGILEFHGEDKITK